MKDELTHNHQLSNISFHQPHEEESTAEHSKLLFNEYESNQFASNPSQSL